MSQSTPAPGGEIAKNAVMNTFWAYLAFLFGKALTFASTVILARLLLPAQFGVVGYCLLALQYFDLLNDFGVGHALIARRDDLEEASNAAFAIGLGISILLYAVGWMISPLIALFFREPLVTDLFRLLSVVFLISGISIVPNALLQRQLRFRDRMLPDVGSTIVKGAVSVVLAWQGFGVWSLIWGQLAGQAFASIVPWFMVRWHPTLKFRRSVFREVFSFGGHMTLVSVVGSFMTNVDYLLVGRILGAAPLGLYTMAYRIPELIIRNTTRTVGKVAFPLLAQLQSEAEQLRGVYFGYLRYLSLFSLPCGAGLALIAAPFMRTFYTQAWEPAIIPMQLIGIAIGLSSVSHIPGIIYKAVNRPNILTRLAMIKLPVVVGVLWVGTRWGINGVAAGQLVLTILSMFLDSIVVSRTIKFHISDMFRSLAPALCSTAIMALVVAALTMVLPASGILSLIALVAAGALAYLGTLTLVSREMMIKASTRLRAALGRS